MSISYNESFVRLYWNNLTTGFKDGDSYAADLWLLDLGAKHFSSRDHFELWQEAADYTRMRLRLIEEVEEQYYWLLHCTDYSAFTLVQERARKTLINETAIKLQSMKMELSL